MILQYPGTNQTQAIDLDQEISMEAIRQALDNPQEVRPQGRLNGGLVYMITPRLVYMVEETGNETGRILRTYAYAHDQARTRAVSDAKSREHWIARNERYQVEPQMHRIANAVARILRTHYAGHLDAEAAFLEALDQYDDRYDDQSDQVEMATRGVSMLATTLYLLNDPSEDEQPEDEQPEDKEQVKWQPDPDVDALNTIRNVLERANCLYRQELLDERKASAMLQNLQHAANSLQNAGPRSQERPLRFYVNEYECNRVYGGYEEGGWWFNTGRLVQTHAVARNGREARQAQKSLQPMLDAVNEGKPDEQSVNCSGYRRIFVENRPGRDYPKQTPTYE